MKYTLDRHNNIISKGEWPKTKRAALRDSIAKWRCVVRWAEEGREVRTGPDSCALCQLYLHETTCRGCPVYEETGEIGCQGTPYVEYPTSPQAKAEVAFLESLLRPTKRTR